MISAVWLVRSHQIAGDLRYWLTYIGYDKRDHSLSHKIYLGYATVFFSIWGFATLAWLAPLRPQVTFRPRIWPRLRPGCWRWRCWVGGCTTGTKRAGPAR